MTHTTPRPGLPGYRSPLLDLPGAVMATGEDEGVALHYGDPVGEHRAALDGVVLMDGTHWPILEITGAGRVSWLDPLLSQNIRDLPPYRFRESVVLGDDGYVENHLYVTEFGGHLWTSTAPLPFARLRDYLCATQPARKGIDVRDVSDEWALVALIGPEVGRVLVQCGVSKPTDMLSVTSLAGGGWMWWMPFPTLDAAYLTVPRPLLTRIAAQLVHQGVRPMGIWSYEAMRVEMSRPRLGMDTDDHTYPQEVGWMETAVSLDKGDFRGRAAVERVQRTGPPPRRLVQVRLDCPPERAPLQGTPVLLDGRRVGFVGSVAPYHVRGPLALALVARAVPDDAALLAGGQPASVVPAEQPVPP